MKRDRLSKDLKKGARRIAKDVKKSVGDLQVGTKGKIVAGAAGLAAAGALGVAAARKSKKKLSAYHVVPAAGDEGWELQLEGRKRPLEVYTRKRSAVSAARKAASDAAPSTLTIHDKVGTIQRVHSYEPA